MKKIIFVLFLALFIPFTTVEGSYCKYSELARLKRMASNINTSYDYVETEEDAIFNITLVNLSEELYLIDLNSETRYDFINSEMNIPNYESGTSVIYMIYSTDEDCGEDPLYTIRINLPSYNMFYKDDLCKGIENYSLCQKWSSNYLGYNEFEKKVKAYKDSLEKDNKVSIEEEEPSLLYFVIQFILENYYFMLIAIIGISGMLIYIINKKSDVYS